jgi:hypothetical protein
MASSLAQIAYSPWQVALVIPLEYSNLRWSIGTLPPQADAAGPKRPRTIRHAKGARIGAATRFSTPCLVARIPCLLARGRPLWSPFRIHEPTLRAETLPQQTGVYVPRHLAREPARHRVPSPQHRRDPLGPRPFVHPAPARRRGRSTLSTLTESRLCAVFASHATCETR